MLVYLEVTEFILSEPSFHVAEHSQAEQLPNLGAGCWGCHGVGLRVKSRRFEVCLWGWQRLKRLRDAKCVGYQFPTTL
jgi:hypothetical protein